MAPCAGGTCPRATRITRRSWPNLAEAFGGQRVVEGGVVMPLADPAATLDELRGRLAGDSPSPATSTFRWALEPRDTRKIAPGLRTSVAEYVQRERASPREEARRAVLRMFPWHPNAKVP